MFTTVPTYQLLITPRRCNPYDNSQNIYKRMYDFIIRDVRKAP